MTYSLKVSSALLTPSASFRTRSLADGDSGMTMTSRSSGEGVCSGMGYTVSECGRPAGDHDPGTEYLLAAFWPVTGEAASAVVAATAPQRSRQA